MSEPSPQLPPAPATPPAGASSSACCSSFARPMRALFFVALVVVVLGAAWLAFGPARYRASRFVLVDSPYLGNLNLVGLVKEGPPDGVRQAYALLQDPRSIDRLVGAVAGLQPWVDSANADPSGKDARLWTIRKAMGIRVPSPGLLEISFTWREKGVAIAAADHLAREIIVLHGERAREETTAAVSKLAQIVEDLERKVALKRARFEEMILKDPVAFHALPPASDHGLTATLPSPSHEALQSYANLKEKLDTLAADTRQTEQEIQAIESRLLNEPETVTTDAGTQANPIRLMLELKLHDLRARFDSVRVQRESIEPLLAAAYEELKDLPRRQLAFQEVRSEYEASVRILEAMRTKLADARITRELELSRTATVLQLDPMPARVEKLRGCAFKR